MNSYMTLKSSFIGIPKVTLVIFLNLVFSPFAIANSDVMQDYLGEYEIHKTKKQTSQQLITNVEVSHREYQDGEYTIMDRDPFSSTINGKPFIDGLNDIYDTQAGSELYGPRGRYHLCWKQDKNTFYEMMQIDAMNEFGQSYNNHCLDNSLVRDYWAKRTGNVTNK